MQILYLILAFIGGIGTGTLIAYIILKQKFSKNYSLTKIESDRLTSQLNNSLSKNASTEAALELVSKNLDEVKKELIEETNRSNKLQTLLAVNEEKMALSSKDLEEKKKDLHKMQEKLKIDFEEIANKLNEERTKKFTESAKHSSHYSANSGRQVHNT